MKLKVKNKTVLIVDDEPQHLDFLSEYLISKGYKVETATNLKDAEKLLREFRYRLVIVDLNIPAPQDYDRRLREKGEVFQNYKGLYVAELARNLGHTDKRVIIYSVHNVPEVSKQAEKLYCRYLLKGRPKVMKQEIDELLFNPREKSI